MNQEVMVFSPTGRRPSTIKQANIERLSIAKDKLDDAYQTVQTWLAFLDEDTAEALEALTGIMEQITSENKEE